MSRRYNENVKDSKQLEEILRRHNVDWNTDASGKRVAERRDGWLVWRQGEFGPTESSHMSNMLRLWGYLVLPLLLSAAVLGLIWVLNQ